MSERAKIITEQALARRREEEEAIYRALAESGHKGARRRHPWPPDRYHDTRQHPSHVAAAH